jgi:hypothetical protein
MKRIGYSLLVVLASAGVARADVKVQERTKFKMEGVMGGVMSLFGGKAAGEGLTRTVVVRGDRKLSLDDTSGELVDLKEEKVYRLDPAKKSYTVVTFEELRKEHKKAQEEMAKSSSAKGEEKPKSRDDEMEVDLDVKKTGQKKAVAGFDAEQTIVTVTARKKGQTLEQGGGTVITQDMWLSQAVKAQDEIRDFDRRYFEKLYGSQQAAMAELALLAATTPGLGKGMEKLQAEGSKIKGYPVMTTMVIETVKSAAEAKPAQAEESPPPTSLGGLFGSVAKKVVQTKSDDSPRSTVLTSTHELLSISKDVGASDTALPAGYQPK